MQAVNAWTAKYKDLLSLLTRCSGIDVVERSILKLQELEETVDRFYESDVAVFASQDDLV